MANFRNFYSVLKHAFFAFVICTLSLFSFDNFAFAGGSSFTAIVTPGDTKIFYFYISAAGDFTVDCGDHGTLGGDSENEIDSESGIITKKDTDLKKYWCEFDGNGKQDIGFGGTATAYSEDYSNAAISFYNVNDSENADNPRKFFSIAGDLSAIFPCIDEKCPTFYESFKGASTLTSIPSTLFSGYKEVGTSYMFASTFENCAGLTSLPGLKENGLFSGISVGYEHMFDSTFENCTSLAALPENLFADVTVGADNMFESTFAGCSTMKGTVPATLFEKLIENKSEATELMKGIFDGTALETSCPEDYYQFETGYEEYWDIGEGKKAVMCESCPEGTQSEAGSVGSGMCYATNINYPFSITTTNLSAGATFTFTMSAQGTFYVDCGTGGTLSGTGVSGVTINRSSITSNDTYTCTYSSGGVKTVQFGGLATGYSSSYAAISFYGNTKLASMSLASGYSLASIFPGSNGLNPGFSFAGCTNLQSIPAGLFKGYTNCWFNSTFFGCSSLTSIPNDLFEDCTTVEEGAFQETFRNCTGLTQLPESLFANITNIITTSSSNHAPIFMETFSGCNNLTGFIPPTLFAGLTPKQASYPSYLMDRTFLGSSLLTSCPTGYYEYFTGYKTQNVWAPYVSCKPGAEITYLCGDHGSFISGGPYSASANTMTIDTGATYTITNAASVCQPDSNYSLQNSGTNIIAGGWECVANDSSSTYLNSSVYNSNATNIWGNTSIYQHNYTCTAQWSNVQNYTVNYSCTNGQYNGTQTLPEGTTVNVPLNTVSCTVPTGYEFAGWYCSHGHTSLALSNVTPTVSVSGVDTNSVYVHKHFDCSGTTCSFELSADTECIALWRNISPCENGGHSAQYILGTPASQFSWLNENGNGGGSTNISFNSYGTITVEPMCSSIPGIPGNAGTPVSADSSSREDVYYCWCRVSGYTGNSNIHSGDLPWVYFGEYDSNSYSQCMGIGDRSCLKNCSSMTAISALFREAMYSTYQCEYNVSYYCDAQSSRPTVESYLPTTSVSTNGHNCVMASGYIMTGWNCSYVDSNSNTQSLNGTSFTMPSYNVTCVAQYDCDTGYQWNSNHTACVPVPVINEQTITYNCGIGSGGATIIENGTSHIVYGSAGSVSNEASCSAPTGYEFAAWYCASSDSTLLPASIEGYNTDVNIPANYFSSYTIYRGETQSVYMNGNMTCVAIWRETNHCSPGTMTESVLMNADWTLNPVGYNAETTGYGVNFVYGMVDVGGQCSVTPGVPGVAGTPDLVTQNGPYCWCHLLGYAPSGGDYETLDNSPWVFYYPYLSEQGCQDSACADACGRLVNNIPFGGWPEGNDISSLMRHGLYTTYDCTYTVTFAPGDTNNDGTGTYATGSMTGLSNKYAGDTITLPSNGFTAPSGYVFNGWNCDNGIGSMAVNSTFPMPANNVTCTAQWMQLFPVQYNCGKINSVNVGGSAPSTTYHAGSATVDISSVQPSSCTPNTGYTFNRWYCHLTSGTTTILNDGHPTWFTMPADSVTCDASWNPPAPTNYILSYVVSVPSGATVDNQPSSTPIVVPEGTSYILASAPTATGYTFNGWSCKDTNNNSICLSDGEPVNCAAGATITMPASNVTCTGTFSRNIYNINYHNVNDTDTWTGLHPNTYSFGYGATIGKPNRTGYNFLGWCVNDPDCTNYANNVSGYTITTTDMGDFDLYANWEPIVYNIVYHNVEDATWSSANDSPSTYTYGIGATIGVPSRQNYAFAGWCVNAASCTGYSSNINGYTIGTNVTGDYNLYAKWNQTYQISYFVGNCSLESNGTADYTNTFIRANDTAVFGQSYAVQLPTSSQLQLVGDTALNHDIDGLENCVQFLGYYDGYAPGGDFSVDYSCNGANCGSFYPNNTYHGIPISDGSLPLYMRCNWVNYPVVYHSCDGSETFEDTGTVYSSSFSIKNYTATGLTLPSGYVFKGWSETANSATAEYPYYSNNSYTMNSCEQSGYKIHLYAVCKLNNFTLTYNVNAPSGVTVTNQPSQLTVSVTAGTSYTLASAPTATGYTFKGWSCKDQYSQSICTDSNNTAINCAASSSITMPESDVICAGQWDVNTITLLWLPDGGTPNPITTPDSCTYGMSNGITGIAQPQKPGYSFAGWEVTNWQ